MHMFSCHQCVESCKCKADRRFPFLVASRSQGSERAASVHISHLLHADNQCDVDVTRSDGVVCRAESNAARSARSLAPDSWNFHLHAVCKQCAKMFLPDKPSGRHVADEQALDGIFLDLRIFDCAESRFRAQAAQRAVPKLAKFALIAPNNCNISHLDSPKPVFFPQGTLKH